MSSVTHGPPCPECCICPSCGRPAYCLADRNETPPCAHDGGWCGDCALDECAACRIEAGLQAAFTGADPFDQGGEGPDPWRTNPAEPHKPYNAAYHEAHRKDSA